MSSPIPALSTNASAPGSTTSSSQASSDAAPPRPTIIGLYGIPGSGKSYHLNLLSKALGSEVLCLEGSQVIADQIPGGLAAFQALGESEREDFRKAAIKSVQTRCVEGDIAGVIAGHYSFWTEHEPEPVRVMTSGDLAAYTHIIYLNVSGVDVARQRAGDTQRVRPSVSSPEHFEKWQQLEISELRSACLDSGILFSVLDRPCIDDITGLIRDFKVHSESLNADRALAELDSIVGGVDNPTQLKTTLVFDADKTLAPEDSGKLFWKPTEIMGSGLEHDPLRTLFSSKLGYSYLAFRQATLLYQDTGSDDHYDGMCGKVAAAVQPYRDLMGLLREAVGHKHVVPVVVTCGLRLVWEKVLHHAGLSGRVRVIGGGRISDGFVVTPQLKSQIVTRLQNHHGLKVWAFGDSPLDVPMLGKADQAIIIVGNEETRSKSMDLVLAEHGIQARQVLFNTTQPRMNATQLPIVKLSDREIIDDIFSRRSSSRILHASDRAAAMLLMTPTRDATVAGPNLREAHRRIGWYLATELVADVIGVEVFPIPHVQGKMTDGYRFRGEQNTLILALMRAGEPMALGVSDAFPLAMFRHVKNPVDLGPEELLGVQTVLLVDSVVNSGTTVVDFIQHIRGLEPAVRIVVVAGVVQSQCLSPSSGNRFALLHQGDENLGLVALRISTNKYKGVGATDTGHRLFNTTHLD